MIGGPCLVGLGLARTGAAIVRVRAAVAAVPSAANLLERPGACGGCRLELGLGSAHSGDLSGVGGEELAAAAALLEANSVARGVRVCGARGAAFGADLHDRGGVVDWRGALVSTGGSAVGGRRGRPAAVRAPGRPCCPCPLRPSAPESRCPCRACRSRSRCRCRCCPSEPDRAPGSVRAWCWWAALGLLGLRRIPFASATALAPGVAVAIPVPVAVPVAVPVVDAVAVALSLP